MQTLLCSTGKVLSKHCDWRRFIPGDGVQFTRSFLQLFRWLGTVYPAKNFRAQNNRLLCEWEWWDGGSRSYPATCRKSAKRRMDVLQKIYRNNPVVMWREWGGGKWWTDSWTVKNVVSESGKNKILYTCISFHKAMEKTRSTNVVKNVGCFIFK